jgi:ABC-type Fe3+-siderophore transport system permease subunit
MIIIINQSLSPVLPMNLLGCVAAFIAMALAYLASRNQRLLRRPLGRPARLGAGAFAIAALAAWIVGETSLPGIFSALTALMLGGVALPYITWLFRPAPERKPR